MYDKLKKDYIEKLESKLAEWSVEINKFKEKLEGPEAKIKDEYHKILEDLHARAENIKIRIRKLEEESGETWEELKYGTDDAWQDMKAAIKKAASKFRDKV